MELRLVIAPTAEVDAQMIFDYIKERTFDGAVRWYLAFQAAATRAREMPESYPLALENSAVDGEVRNFLFKTRRGHTYRGLFIVRDSELRVLRVRGPGQPRIRKSDLPLDS